MGVGAINKTDIDKLFRLLNGLYSKSPHPENDRDKCLAWYMALEPYEYEAVKAAVMKRLKTNRFYPDVGEILEFLPEPPTQDSTIIDQMKRLRAQLEKWRRDDAD